MNGKGNNSGLIDVFVHQGDTRRNADPTDRGDTRSYLMAFPCSTTMFTQLKENEFNSEGRVL